MGDLIHTLPALSDAKKRHPEIRFDWVAEQAFAEIPSWHAAVEDTIPIRLRSFKRQPFSSKVHEETVLALRRLRSRRYEYIIDAQGLIKSAAVGCLARGDFRAGMDWSSCKEGAASLAYRKRFKIDRNRHAIDRIRELFAKIFEYDYDDIQLDYGLNRRKFGSFPAKRPYVVFLHGTSAEKKLWNNVEWIQLARFADETDFDVLLPWGNSEERLRAETLASTGRNLTVLPSMGLTEMAGVLAGARGVVGVDTGLSHLAAALGTPATTLYLATSPWLTGTRGQYQLCLFTPDLDDRFAPGRHSVGETGSRIVTRIDAASVWTFLQEQIASSGRSVGKVNSVGAPAPAND
jgi:heptosyltransferase I